MSDMVERVAFAIAVANRDLRGQVRPSEFFDGLARAAIGAMREPTEEMVRAALWYVAVPGVLREDMQDAWRDAIDAALSPRTDPAIRSSG